MAERLQLPVSGRRDSRRERTRERLIGAAAELLRLEGHGAVSVSAVARRVGVRHSLFYQHFKDMDACLAAAAARVLVRLAPVDRELRQVLLARAVTDRRRLALLFHAALDRWLAERPLLELLLAHRLERSAMGEAFASALHQMRSEMAAELWELARQLGTSRASLDDVHQLADLHLAHWLWALESSVAGRSPDRAKFARRLADIYVDTNNSFFERASHPSYEELVETTFDSERRQELKQRRQAMVGFVTGRSDAEVIAAYGPEGLAGAVRWLMDQLVAYFLPAAARFSVVILYRVHWQGQEAAYAFVIEDGTCLVKPLEECGPPSLTVRFSFRTFLDCVAGIRHFDECYRGGALELEGGMLLGADVVGWFFEPVPEDLQGLRELPIRG